MNLFKTFRLNWWQAAFFKSGMLALGIVIGAHWHSLLSDYLPVLILVAAVSLTYVTYVWAKQ